MIASQPNNQDSLNIIVANVAKHAILKLITISTKFVASTVVHGWLVVRKRLHKEFIQSVDQNMLNDKIGTFFSTIL